MARSYNRIELIGNLTHDPELRATPKGTRVCGFRLATDRSWLGENGQRHEETAYHRIVAWNTLAEQCAKLLRKGRKVFVAGRLSYRTRRREDGTEMQLAEVVISEMLLLDEKRTLPDATSQDKSIGTVTTGTSLDSLDDLPTVDLPEPPLSPVGE